MALFLLLLGHGNNESRMPLDFPLFFEVEDFRMLGTLTLQKLIFGEIGPLGNYFLCKSPRQPIKENGWGLIKWIVLGKRFLFLFLAAYCCACQDTWRSVLHHLSGGASWDIIFLTMWDEIQEPTVDNSICRLFSRKNLGRDDPFGPDEGK